MNLIKLLLNNFLIAVGFLTRIPIASWVKFDNQNLRNSGYYFPVVAWLIALLLVFIYSLFSLVLPLNVSVILLMICGVLVTGALHEDGLADICDAVGVMGDKQQKLEAMKDSRLGSFGVIALILVLGCKFILITEQSNIVISILIAFGLSRLFAFTFLISKQYIQTQSSKSKQFSALNPVIFNAVLLISVLPVFYFIAWQSALILMLSLIILRFCLLGVFKKHIGGVNGDAMGASQQVSELIILLVLI